MEKSQHVSPVLNWVGTKTNMPICVSYKDRMLHISTIKKSHSSRLVTFDKLNPFISTFFSKMVLQFLWQAHLLSSSRHVFTNYQNTILQSFSPIFSQLKKKINSLLVEERQLFLSFEHLRKSEQILHISRRKKLSIRNQKIRENMSWAWPLAILWLSLSSNSSVIVALLKNSSDIFTNLFHKFLPV